MANEPGVGDATKLGRLVGTSRQNIEGILGGIKRPKCMPELARAMRTSIDVLVAGQYRYSAPPPNWTSEQHPSEGARPRGRVAQILSHPPRSDTPFVVWGAVMKKDLPPIFSVSMPDDSMAPWIMAGDIVRFSQARAPRAGEIVLAVDNVGGWYARVYRPGRAGHWKASPLNEAF